MFEIPPELHQRRSTSEGDVSQNDALLLFGLAPPTNGVVKQRLRPYRPLGRLCQGLLVLTILVLLFIVLSQVYSFLHSTDPCIRAQRSLLDLANLTTRSSSDRTSASDAELPKIIHQQWKDSQIPRKFQAWHEAFHSVFPHHRHMLWTDESSRHLIANNYSWFLPVYDQYQPSIKKVDAARYFILHAYGGLYADLDYEPLVDFWNYLPQDRVAIVESPHQYNEYHQNSLISSPRNDPFWLKAFELLKDRQHMSVLHATGPSFLDALVSFSSEYYYTLPCENFHRMVRSSHSPIFTRLWNHHIVSQLYPMKSCGDFHNPQCQWGRHYNTVSWGNGWW